MGDPCPSVWGHFPDLPRTPAPLGIAAGPAMAARGPQLSRHGVRESPSGGGTGRRCSWKGCVGVTVTTETRFCVEHEPDEDES
jgi:hypothetical protein